jgi:hypothetical protein
MSRIRADRLTNRAADGAPLATNGLVVTGVATATSFSGSGANLTGVVATGVGTLAQLSVTGVTTATGGVIGNVTGNLTGNAGTATSLATARTIGGVSFDGTANINLPGVNASGTQDTSGTAANASGATGDFSIADKIVHTGDTNTAIRFPSADTFTIETAGTERVRVASDGVFTAKAGAVAEIATLTSATTVTPDFATSANFTLTLGHNVTLANPSNLTPGQSGSIFLVQDGTGSRTITFGSQYDFAGGTAPTLSTAASSVDRLDYIVRTSSSIHCVVTLAYS